MLNLFKSLFFFVCMRSSNWLSRAKYRQKLNQAHHFFETLHLHKQTFIYWTSRSTKLPCIFLFRLIFDSAGAAVFLLLHDNAIFTQLPLCHSLIFAFFQHNELPRSFKIIAIKNIQFQQNVYK